MNARKKLGTMSMLRSHSLTPGSQEHSLTYALTLSLSLSLNMLNKFCFHVYAQKSLSHFHTLSLSHSRTLSFSHSFSLDILNNFCFHLYAQKSHSHSHTLTLSLLHTLSLSHSFNLSFNHSRHAEQFLFSCLCSKLTVYRRKLQ